MKREEISRLLEKYYRGETSVEEELSLRIFFEGVDIPGEFEAEKAIFRFYSESAAVPEPSSGFEANILFAVDEEEKKRIRSIFRQKARVISGIAAGLLLLIGSYFIFSKVSEPEDTFSNPEIAYAATVKILYDVSSQLNQGTAQLEKISKFGDAAKKSLSAIDRSAQLIDNNLRNLDYFQQAIQMVNSPMEIVKKK
jgi:hypothetical protein